MYRFLMLALLFSLLPGVAGAANARSVSLETLRNSPLYFEPNLGQTAPEVRYLARGQGYVFFLTEDEAVWRLHPRLPDQVGQVTRPRSAVIRLRLGGAEATPSPPRALEPLPQVSHYYIGRDPRRWAEGVPAYGRVRYEGVYPGIDMEFYGKGPLLEYDFVVAPGADPRHILLEFSGADRLRLTPAGDLLIEAGGETGGVRLRHHRPFAYQVREGRRQAVAADFVLRDGQQVAFRLGDYDPALPLVIDPAVTLATYLGGGWDDAVQAVAVDGAGAIYVTGRTTSTDFPATTGAVSGSLFGSDDLFVAKLAPDGRIVYATYLGSGETFVGIQDSGRGIALDDQGRVYVTGSVGASFTFFATSGAFDTEFNGGETDAFVIRLKADGLLDYASYLGDEQRFDVGTAIAVGADGLVYVAGYTAQATKFPSTFPVKNGAQTTHGGATDAFLVKLDLETPGAQALRYGTFFGGGGGEEALALALAGNGVAYIAGITNSDGLATQGVYQSGWVGNDGFIARLDTRTPGTAGLTATYINAPGCGFADTKDAVRVAGLAVADGDVVAAGDTLCDNLPLTGNAFDTTFGGTSEAFVLALDDNLASLRFASFFGGSGDETAAGIALDGFGQAYLVGGTTSSGLPGSGVNAANFPYRGGEDAFVAKLARQDDGGFGLRFSLYLGGSGDDRALAVAADATGNVHVAGRTASGDFPTYLAPTGPQGQALSDFQGGQEDGFLLRFGPVADLALAVTDNDPVAVGSNVVFDMRVDNQGPDDAQGVTVTATLPASLSYLAADSDSRCSYDGGSRGVACALGTLRQGEMPTLRITARLDADNRETVDFNVSALVPDVVPGNNTVTVRVNDDDPAAGGGSNPPPPLTITDGDGGVAGGSGGRSGGGGGGVPGLALLLILGAGYFSRAFAGSLPDTFDTFRGRREGAPQVRSSGEAGSRIHVPGLRSAPFGPHRIPGRAS